MRIYIYNETASVKTDNVLRLDALVLKFVDAIWIFLKAICIFGPCFTLGISESPSVMVCVLSSKTGRQMAFFICISSVQSLSHVRLFAIPWTAACQASLSITNSRSLLKLTSIELVMPFNHPILCYPLLLLPSIFPSIRVFSNESVLHNRWPKYQYT